MILINDLYMLYTDWEKVILVKTFSTIMNLPPLMTEKKNYSKIARTIHKAVKTVAGSCTSDAAKEIKTITWFRRGSQVPPFKVLPHSQKF